MAVPQKREGRKASEIPEVEVEECRKWFKRIDAAVERGNTDGLWETMKRNTRLYEGFEAGAPEAERVRTNIIFSTIATVYPTVYARNPDISISPTEAVDPTEYKKWRLFAKAAESLVQRQLVRRGKLKRRAKQALRDAMVRKLGWVKLTWQASYRGDPEIQSRYQDIQDNLASIEAASKEADFETDVEVQERYAEMTRQMEALTSQVEANTQRGLVIDNVEPEDILLLDETVKSADGYTSCSGIAQRYWLSKDDFVRKFGQEPDEGATKHKRPATGEAGQASSNNDVEDYYEVFEVWNLTNLHIYTLVRGGKGYARAPFTRQQVGAHWYPFFPLILNPVPGKFYPISDVELLERLQNEYEDTRGQLHEHRRDSLPVRIARAGGQLTEEDIKAIQNRKARDIVVVSGGGGLPLAQELFEFPSIRIDPAVYDVTPIRGDIELMSGAGDAARGNVTKAKTATEAEILQQGLTSRTSERQDAIEDWIQRMAEYALEICLIEMTPEQVAAIAGPAAAEVWPQGMSRDEVYNLVAVEVKAGTSGKPDKVREREAWAQIMPIIKEGMMQVTELRATGQLDMANAVVELVRETLRRFDERIDVDKFIPPLPEDGSMDPAAMGAQAMAENAQLKEQLALMQEELAKLQSGEAEAQRQAAAQQEERVMRAEEMRAKTDESRATREADVVLREREIDAKVAAEENIARLKTDAQSALEMEKIASAERVALMQAAVKLLSDRMALAAQPKEAAEPGEMEAEEPEAPEMPDRQEMTEVASMLGEMTRTLQEILNTQRAPKRVNVQMGPDGMPSVVDVAPTY